MTAQLPDPPKSDAWRSHFTDEMSENVKICTPMDFEVGKSEYVRKYYVNTMIEDCQHMYSWS